MYLENEPLVDPRLIPRMETVINEVPFQLMEVSTNAALLSKERADQFVRTISRVPHQIWISFHGKDKRTYEGIMGLDFEKTLERVIYLLKLAENTPLNITVRGSGEPMREVLRHEYSFTEAEYRAFWTEQFAKHGLTAPPAINYFRYHDRCGTIQRNNIRLQENVRNSLKDSTAPAWIRGCISFTQENSASAAWITIGNRYSAISRPTPLRKSERVKPSRPCATWPSA